MAAWGACTTGRILKGATVAAVLATGAAAATVATTVSSTSTGSWPKAANTACSESNRVSKGSSCTACRASVPICSMDDSMRWAISPSRIAPARRALPLSVCNKRKISLRAAILSGWATHWRSAVPSWGMSSAASSSKMGKRSSSRWSSASMSSSCASAIVRGAATAMAGAAISGIASTKGIVGKLSSNSETGSSITSIVAWSNEGAGNSVSVIVCSSASTRASASFRKPAANWCNKRRISSAASLNTEAWSAVPWRCNCTCCRACSRARAISESAENPTVAELPKRECASAMTESGKALGNSMAHSLSSVCKRRDHSSASLRYTL